MATGNGTVQGVGRDAPTKTNAHGGKQSDSPYRSDLLPPHALLEIAKVLKHGADKYGENNWHNLPARENIDHAMTHLLAYLAGDGSDDHLQHAGCRILFALDQVASGREAKLTEVAKPEPPADPNPPLGPSGYRVGDVVRIVAIGDYAFGRVVSWDGRCYNVCHTGPKFVESSGNWLPSSLERAPELIGGFKRGERVRVATRANWRGICDHVSPTGEFIRLWQDGETKPDSGGWEPNQLVRI